MASEGFGSSRNLSKTGSEMTVFERQQTQLKFQQQQQYQSVTTGDINQQNSILMLDHLLGWPEFGHISMPKEMLHSSSDCSNKYAFETSSLTTGVSYKKAVLEKEGDSSFVTPKSDLEIINESLMKRKMDQLPPRKFITDIEAIDKRIKIYSAEEESSFAARSISRTNISKGVSEDTSRGNSMMSDVTKPDYIHVRARRGQATDRHSLAERVRREKISQKMRFLQELVPGCNKITGKTGMLDEIINYVQALQYQVEFLSMKLASVTTTVDFHNGNILPAEVLVEKVPRYPKVIVPDAHSHGEFSMNQIHAAATLETVPESLSTLHRRTMNSDALVQNNFLETATANYTAVPAWDVDSQAFAGLEFHQGRSARDQFTMF